MPGGLTQDRNGDPMVFEMPDRVGAVGMAKAPGMAGYAVADIVEARGR